MNPSVLRQEIAAIITWNPPRYEYINHEGDSEYERIHNVETDQKKTVTYRCMAFYVTTFS